MKRSLKALVVAAACSAALAGSAPAAQASDPGDCSSAGFTTMGYLAQYCTLWQNNVPVYASFSDNPAYGGTVVGHLRVGGRANWFLYQCLGNTSYLGGFHNSWWAYTEADGNHKWGYVPLTYFKGGVNEQRSARLPFEDPYTQWCGGPTTYPQGH